MLLWRVLTAVVLAPVVLAAIFAGRPGITAVVVIAVTIAAYELSRALTLPFPAALGAGAVPVLLSVLYGTNGVLAGTLLSLPWALAWLAGKSEARTLRSVLALLLMALWVGAPLSHLGIAAALPGGRLLVAVAVVGPWISDAGAYFSGRLFGRRKLFPSMSPNKTAEGAAGGLMVTTAIVAPFAYAFLGFTPAWAALLGVSISVSSQAGDLFESVLKRILELKDLGSLLPGHGGLLDRIDSLLFTAPTVYYLYTLIS